MYLNKVYIPWSQAKNPYQLHQALWHLFPGHEDDDRTFLFRVEQQQKGVGTQILMQSKLVPESNEQGPEVLEHRKYNLQLQNGQRLRFRLRANPIKTIKDSNKGCVEKKGKTYTKTVRVPLLHEEQQQAWLERKLHNSASLETLLIQPEPLMYFHKSKENRSGKIQPILFDGILTVVDMSDFIRLLQQGIGPAKAFGCGLLSVAKG